MFRMAQAVVLQYDILSKDLSSIDIFWADSLRSQERYQASYSSQIHEVIENIKRSPNETSEISTEADNHPRVDPSVVKYNQRILNER